MMPSHRIATRPTLRQRWNRLVFSFTLLAIVPLALGCYGRFPLTKAVYRLNGDISGDKWIRSIVFWIFLIIPVYELANLADAIVLNLIEFWTGESIDVSQGTDAAGNRVALVPSADGNEATLTVSSPDGTALHEGRFVRADESSWTILDGNGEAQGSVVYTADGSIEIRDTDNHVLRAIPAALVQLAHQPAAEPYAVPSPIL
jgi:hypothetical protein